MSRTATSPRAHAAVPEKIARPRAGGAREGRAAARRQLELLAGALGWTSVELERQRALCEAAWSAGARPDAAAQFESRLLAWSRTALERRPEAIESPRLAALAELAQVARDAKDMTDALTRALAALRRSVGYENATFFLYDRETETLLPAATTGAHVDLIPDVQFDLGQGLSSWVARSRRPVLLSALRGDEESEVPGTRPGSFLSVPLIVSQDLVGVLNVGHSRPGAFTEADRDLLSSAGAILASTLSRQLAFDEARRRSVTDELTGLANREQLGARLVEEIEKARRYGYPFSLVLVDPDRFAALNQAYGRPYGDSCLVSLAGLLRSVVRKSDLVARLAPGDEFAVLLPHQGDVPARAAGERIRSAIESHAFPRRRRLTAQVGVATYPAHADSPEALLRAAEAQLSRARS